MVMLGVLGKYENSTSVFIMLLLTCINNIFRYSAWLAFLYVVSRDFQMLRTSYILALSGRTL